MKKKVGLIVCVCIVLVLIVENKQYISATFESVI